MDINPVKIITLVPPDARKDWLAQCVESVRIQEGIFQHCLISCSDLYSGRKETYQWAGRIICVDYDDWLEPGILVEIGKISGPLVFTAPAPVSVSQIRRNSLTIHHLVAFNSSLVPESFYKEIESRGLQIHVDWLVKAYVALKYGAIRSSLHGYNWRRHPEQFSFKNRGAYGKITQECIRLLAEVPVLEGFLVTN